MRETRWHIGLLYVLLCQLCYIIYFRTLSIARNRCKKAKPHIMAVFLEHSYSMSTSRRSCGGSFPTNGSAKRKRCAYLNSSPALGSDGDECRVCETSSPSADDRSHGAVPLSLLFPDCILCLWSANIFSHAIVAELHRNAVKYAGDKRPHAAAYWSCVNDWYERHKVAELAPSLTKEDCVAHFTSNILCQFNRQRCQVALLYNRKLVSQLVNAFPTCDSVVFVTGHHEHGEGNHRISWCHNAFFCFLIVQLTRLCNITLLEKKQHLLSLILERHTDFFIAQWVAD